MLALRVLLLATLVSCSHLASVSVSSIPVQRKNMVRTEVSRVIFFGMNFNNHYVDQLTVRLARQCPEGRVKGVLSKQEKITYFPVIAHKVRVSAEGYCVR